MRTTYREKACQSLMKILSSFSSKEVQMARKLQDSMVANLLTIFRILLSRDVEVLRKVRQLQVHLQSVTIPLRNRSPKAKVIRSSQAGLWTNLSIYQPLGSQPKLATHNNHNSISSQTPTMIARQHLTNLNPPICHLSVSTVMHNRHQSLWLSSQ
jgi:hypothetical protein